MNSAYAVEESAEARKTSFNNPLMRRAMFFILGYMLFASDCDPVRATGEPHPGVKVPVWDEGESGCAVHA